MFAPSRRRTAAVLLSLGCFLWPAICAGQAADSLWLVSTRRVPSSASAAAGEPLVTYHFLDGDGRWASADRERFLSTDDRAVPTVFYIHGNRSTSQDAVSEGMYVRGLVRQHAAGPFRMVIWSWPADRICGGPRADVQTKAARTDVESYYLASLVSRMNAQVRVGWIGYSFGARVILGGLEILAGGTIAGRSLPEPAAPGAPMRAILLAAALDADWILPGHRDGRALGELERVLVTLNQCDPAMKWYPLMYCRGGPPALGFCGPTCPQLLGAEAEKVALLPVSNTVGRTHNVNGYLDDPPVQAHLGWCAFAEPPRR